MSQQLLFHLVQLGLDKFDLAKFGLVEFGLAKFGLAKFSLAKLSQVCLVWYDLYGLFQVGPAIMGDIKGD